MNRSFVVGMFIVLIFTVMVIGLQDLPLFLDLDAALYIGGVSLGYLFMGAQCDGRRAMLLAVIKPNCVSTEQASLAAKGFHALQLGALYAGITDVLLCLVKMLRCGVSDRSALTAAFAVAMIGPVYASILYGISGILKIRFSSSAKITGND